MIFICQNLAVNMLRIKRFELQKSNSFFSFSGPMGWIVRQMSNNVDPKNVISQIMPGVSFVSWKYLFSKLTLKLSWIWHWTK